VREHGLVLLTLEKADANVVLPKHGEVWLVMKVPCFDCQAEHSLQHGQLTVDLAD
jgi:hypothetical protein